MLEGRRAWWSDDPIQSNADDALGRRSFAGRLAGLLDEIARRPSSTVVGLVGPWGSGKSSTVNLARQQLREGWTIVDINPWALPGPEYLIAEILAAITQVEPLKGDSGDRLRSALTRYAKYAVPLISAVPVVGSALASSGAAVLEDVVAGQTQPKQAAELNRLLDELKPRLLVVIDDVDRLQPDELLALFRAIRVLGRLNHVHYLLSYDEKTMLDVLARTDLARGNPVRALDFLEKIVTVRLDQPPTREEQAAELFDQQLELLQSSLGFAISEEQWSRLNVEREALLNHQLTEPRGIRRFFTQLHAYLPLVGPDEVDVVDFMVLSFLRMSYPSLYDAVRIDRRALVDAGLASQLDPDPIALRLFDELKRAADHSGIEKRLRWALERMFPLIDPDGSRNLDPLRAGRRVADPDHVDRYFALTPQDDDLSTSELVASLADFAGKHPTDRTRNLGRLLSPVSVDRRDWDQAARLFRRAAVHAANLQPSAAGVLLEAGLTLAPATVPPGLPLAALYAAESWFAALIRAAGPEFIGPREEWLGEDPHQPTTFVAYLSALRAVLAQSDDPGRYARAVQDATELAWRRFVANVELGDAAPHERTADLLHWVRDHLTPEELQQRISREIERGLSVADLAARLVITGRNSSGHDTMLDLDVALARALLGGEPGLAAVGVLQADMSNAQPRSEPDEDDVSWPSLRRVGVERLLKALNARARFGATTITADPDLTLTRYQPSLVSQVAPGLYLNGNVMLPSRLDVSIQPEIDPSLVGTREYLLVELARSSPLATWAAGQSERWSRARLTDWAISPSSSRNFSAATATLVTAQDPDNPVVVAEFGMQLQAERQSSPGAARPILLSSSVGIYSEPTPRLELHELYGLLMAVMLQVGVVWKAWDALVIGHPKPPDADLSLDMRATAAVTQFLDMDAVDQQGNATAQLLAQWRMQVDPPGAPVDLKPMMLMLNGSLAAWLIDSKFRNVEAAIESAAQSYLKSARRAADEAVRGLTSA